MSNKTTFVFVLFVVMVGLITLTMYKKQIEKDRDHKVEIKKLQNEIQETKKSILDIEEAIPSEEAIEDTSYVDLQMEELRYEMAVQEEEREYEETRRGWCERDWGTYYGNGTCITP